jgi:hypothetical protein
MTVGGPTKFPFSDSSHSLFIPHCAFHLQLIRAMPTVHLLDYVAGNVRSLVNAIEKVGYTVEWVKSPADVPSAEVRRSFLPHTHTN